MQIELIVWLPVVKIDYSKRLRSMISKWILLLLCYLLIALHRPIVDLPMDVYSRSSASDDLWCPWSAVCDGIILFCADVKPAKRLWHVNRLLARHADKMTLTFPPTNDSHPNARNRIDSKTPKIRRICDANHLTFITDYTHATASKAQW